MESDGQTHARTDGQRWLLSRYRDWKHNYVTPIVVCIQYLSVKVTLEKLQSDLSVLLQLKKNYLKINKKEGRPNMDFEVIRMEPLLSENGDYLLQKWIFHFVKESLL